MMPGKRRDKPISEEVIAAFVQLEANAGSQQALEQLMEWADDAPQKLDEFEALAALWERLGDIEPDSTLMRPQAKAQRGHPSSWLSRMNRWWLSIGGLVAASSVAVVLWLEIPARQSEAYTTTRGEIQQVRLVDGSEVHLNGLTQIQVDMRQQARSISLVKGEAYFQVAKDPERSFVVDLSGAKVRAVGTAFNIDRVPDSARISVMEGIVEVDVLGEHQDSIRADAGEEVLLTWAMVNGRRELASLTRKTMEDTEHPLSWQQGLVHLNGETLEQALERINRQSDRGIFVSVGDERIKSFPVYGTFSIKNTKGFLEALSMMYPIEWIEDQKSVVLRFKRKPHQDNQKM